MRSRLIAPARWLGGRRAMLPVAARVLCARAVRESLRFFVRELLRPPGIHMYRLRSNGVRVAIRHAGVDAATLAEVFYHGYYEAPDEVAGPLGEPTEILDLGANIGLFGAFAVTRWPKAQILAYEPDPANADSHERTIAANGLADRWKLVRAAAGSRDGEVRFASGLNVASHIADEDRDSGEATITVPLCDVLPQVASAGLVKMDIEGGEWAILSDPRFATHPPQVVVLEYHPEGCPDGDPRAAADRALKQAGLETAPIWHGEDGYGMVWGWRRLAGAQPSAARG
ncbi:MAG TPA: FkbM family methyltransferase [Solirubrobacteraceae bacterium]|jgi:FkbM family methyltransferase|nr:FkbM family methyltransferase [Solirubrobacteraceae bacterium]